MTGETPLLEVRDVSLSFRGVRALSHVTFSVSRGELFSIIGPNGAGKTSMLNCVSGRYTPTDGRVLIDGRDVTQMRPSARAGLGIGRTFQNLALFSHMSVLDNIMVGRPRCPTACASGSNSPGRWRLSPGCFSSTNRWPA